MILPYNTVATYEQRWSEAYVDAARAQAAQMVADGKTDGNYISETPNGIELPPQIITRNWIDLAAAQEWKTFCEGLGSVTIVIGGPTT